MISYGSVCSGIEAATAAWHPLGWKPAFFSEIDNFPRAVLKHHYPTVPLHGDFTTIKEGDYEPIDLLVGGTPCQSFSVAGLRKGLADERGNLTLEFIRLAQRLRPLWLVWENVPGVLSIDGGRAFGSFLGGLAELGYGFAYRVLDAQYFGVPQRRRRVFVIGYLGDWRPPAAVLFEREGLRGDITPRRKAGEGITCTAQGIAGNCSSKWAKGTGGPAGDEHYNLIVGGIDYENNAHGPDEPTGPLLKGSPSGGGRPLPAVVTRENVMCVHGTQDPDVNINMAHTLGRNTGQENAVFLAYENHMQDSRIKQVDVFPAIPAKAGTGGGNLPLVQNSLQVRRLTPRECERLQGFPDDYTLIPSENRGGGIRRGWPKIQGHRKQHGRACHALARRKNTRG